MKNWTYGIELELGDVDTKLKLPKYLGSWDYKDSSIMNSNGTANDPKKILNRYGSEIQVEPEKDPKLLAEKVFEIYKFLEYYSLNFTTNMHIHIRIPGLKGNLFQLKKFAKNIQLHGREIFETIEPIPVPTRSEYPEDVEYKGAWKRYLRRRRSHQTLPTAIRYREIMESRTPLEFYYSFAQKDKKGKPQFHLVQRPGINLMQLWSPTETIEFRCFVMTGVYELLINSVDFVRYFCYSVLNGGWKPPTKNYRFQKFFSYDYKRDKIFQLTNVRHNSRQEAERNYQKLFDKGILKRKDVLP